MMILISRPTENETCNTGKRAYLCKKLHHAPESQKSKREFHHHE